MLIIGAIIGLRLSYTSSATYKFPSISYKQAGPVLAVANYGIPIRLIIPSINLNINLESVGVAANGAMAIPVGRNNAAWFNLGSRPGEIGDAVIDGHYGFWKNGTPTVFNNLNKLNHGDIIYIEENNGVTVPFVVTGSQIYHPNQNDTNLFVSSDNLSHLNIITCQGKWNPSNKTYSDRLVVFSNRLSV